MMRTIRMLGVGVLELELTMDAFVHRDLVWCSASAEIQEPLGDYCSEKNDKSCDIILLLRVIEMRQCFA